MDNDDVARWLFRAYSPQTDADLARWVIGADVRPDLLQWAAQVARRIHRGSEALNRQFTEIAVLRKHK